jgi:seryl-tRNA synthetase
VSTVLQESASDQPAPGRDGAAYTPLFSEPALVRSLGVDGVYARTEIYEHVHARLSALISSLRPVGAQVLRFPPVMSRDQLEKAGYLSSFPNLLGCVCALHGSEEQIRAAAARQSRDDHWTEALTPADLVLTPAACYPLYPLVAQQGPVPTAGRLYDVTCDCFRHEPSRHLNRLQSFRMREFVTIGAPDFVTDFGKQWMTRIAVAFIERLGLSFEIAPASDPFFGRVGQVMAISQLQQSLKYELLLALPPGGQATACMSFNYHRDHFGEVWGLHETSGAMSHTGCVAFGMDRLTTGLFWKHGIELARWPESVQRALSL